MYPNTYWYSVKAVNKRLFHATANVDYRGTKEFSIKPYEGWWITIPTNGSRILAAHKSIEESLKWIEDYIQLRRNIFIGSLPGTIRTNYRPRNVKHT